jgi:hypothetical protein
LGKYHPRHGRTLVLANKKKLTRVESSLVPEHAVHTGRYGLEKLMSEELHKFLFKLFLIPFIYTN